MILCLLIITTLHIHLVSLIPYETFLVQYFVCSFLFTNLMTVSQDRLLDGRVVKSDVQPFRK